MGKITVESVSCGIKSIYLKPNSTLIFRQCLPHQGMAYKSANVRVFSYLMVKSLPKMDENSTFMINLHPEQHITEEKLKKVGAFIPKNKKFIKNIIKKRKKKVNTPPRRSKRLTSI